MTNTTGKRRGTRYMFSRGYKKHGVTGLAKYLKVYKVGDYVDVKVRYCISSRLCSLPTIPSCECVES